MKGYSERLINSNIRLGINPARKNTTAYFMTWNRESG
jgi:hypothetical protein